MDFLNGYKTYIMAAIAAVSAIGAYINHSIDGPALAAALWAALQTAFMRNGSKTDTQQVVAEIKKAS